MAARSALLLLLSVSLATTTSQAAPRPRSVAARGDRPVALTVPRSALPSDAPRAPTATTETNVGSSLLKGRALPYVALGAGAAGLVVSGLVYAGAKQDGQTLRYAAAGRLTLTRDEVLALREGETKKTRTAAVVAGLGLAGMAAGALMLMKAPNDTSASVAFVPGESVSISVTGVIP